MNPHIEKEAGAFDERVTFNIEYKEYDLAYAPHSIMKTNNGYQWSGFALRNLDEVRALHDAVGQYIRECEREDVT